MDVSENDFRPKTGRHSSWWPLDDTFRHGVARSMFGGILPAPNLSFIEKQICHETDPEQRLRAEN